MATIIKRETKAGIRWQLQVRLPGVKSIIKTFDNEDDARVFGRTVEQEARNALANPVIRPPEEFYATKLKDAIESYLKSPVASPRDSEALVTVKKHVGLVTMGGINREFAKAYTDRMLATHTIHRRNFTPATVATHYTVIKKVYTWLAEFYHLPPKNLPFTRDHLPRGWEAPRTQRVSKNQVRRLTAPTHRKSRLGRHLRLLIRLALETGARLQEMVLAEWNEFDLENALWTIPAMHSKTNRSRIIPLSFRARRILKVLLKIADKSDKAFHCFASADAASVRFLCAARRAGVKVRFHDLRHEAITRMVKRHPTLPPLTLMKIAGHSSLEMLDRYYNPDANDLKGLFG